MAEGVFAADILKPEDQAFQPLQVQQFLVPFDVPVVEKKLTFEEASKCLNTLGKDESGARYAYLRITATDRKLTDVSIILNFKHVLFLDLDGNLLDLEALQVLTNMPFLVMLNASRNRLESAGLDRMPYLQVLNFNLNKIEETCDIAQPMLDTLNLEFNQIFTAQFDSQKLPVLIELDLKGNQLIDLSGTYPESLERLFVAQNNIATIRGLAGTNLTNLTTLHLRDNKIRKLNGFSEDLSKLTCLNLRNNNIMKLRQFRKLACLPRLETIIYTGNPVEGKSSKGIELEGEGAADNEDDENFGEDGPPPKKLLDLDPLRIGMLVLLPNLKRINKTAVSLQEREEAFLIKQQMLEKIIGEESSDEETEPPTTTYTSEMGDETETEVDTSPDFRGPVTTDEEEEI